MPIVIALETCTATATLSMARVRSGAIVVWYDWESSARNLQPALFTAIHEGWRVLQAKPEDTTAFVVGSGPGSFTGLKLGLGIGKTFAQILPHCQLFAVPTWYGALPKEPRVGEVYGWTLPSTRHTSYLTAIGIGEEGVEELIPLGDFENAQVASTLGEVVDHGTLLIEPAAAIAPPAVASLLPAGWRAEAVRAQHAGRLLELHVEQGAAWAPDDPLTLVPNYIRPPQATLVRRPRLFADSTMEPPHGP